MSDPIYNIHRPDTRIYDIEVYECPACGIHYGLDRVYARNRREAGQQWCCPNGDQIRHDGNEVEKIRAMLTAERKLRSKAELELFRIKQAEKRRTCAQ